MNFTFEHLAQCEPRLIDLETQCREARKVTKKAGDRERLWYHDLKHQMLKLVGFMREKNPRNMDCRLYSTEAYDVAYRHLIKVLEI
jgi:hypothetical protein